MSKTAGVRSFGLSGRSDHVRSIVYVSWVLAFGSADAATFMFMLSNWYGKGSREDGFIYKTSAEIELETGIKRKRQETLRNALVKSGAITVKKILINRKHILHYKLNQSVAQALISDAEKMLDNSK